MIAHFKRVVRHRTVCSPVDLSSCHSLGVPKASDLTTCVCRLFSLYDQVDTKFTFYNPNRTYSDVTRTWSMFVGNTTLLRTVNDTVSSSSSSSQFSSKRLSTFYPVHVREENDYLLSTPMTDESIHYDEIDLDMKPDAASKEEVMDEVSSRKTAIRSSHRRPSR